MKRIHILQDQLNLSKIGAAVFFSEGFDPNTFYLSGFEGTGTLVVPARKQPFLFVPKMELRAAEKTGITPLVQNDQSQLRRECLQMGVRLERVGLDFGSARLSRRRLLPGSRVTDVSNILSGFRAFKSGRERTKIQESCSIAESCIKSALSKWDSFMTESDVASFLESKAQKLGCRRAFEPIIASGSNAGNPHHRPSASPLKKGLCVIDFGVRYHGYCSDISRTICIGSPRKELLDAYYTAVDAQSAAITSCACGISCKELFEIACKSLKSWGDRFIHGLGHGIGVDIHESPLINSRSKEVLKPGMCFTIEPGIYTQKFGVRVEDDLVLNKTQARLFTRPNKGLLIF